ncbi:hypothetical protein CBL_07263 [Carabus blaptoides fortunei]
MDCRKIDIALVQNLTLTPAAHTYIGAMYTEEDKISCGRLSPDETHLIDVFWIVTCWYFCRLPHLGCLDRRIDGVVTNLCSWFRLFMRIKSEKKGETRTEFLGTFQ